MWRTLLATRRARSQASQQSAPGQPRSRCRHARRPGWRNRCAAPDAAPFFCLLRRPTLVHSLQPACWYRLYRSPPRRLPRLQAFPGTGPPTNAMLNQDGFLEMYGQYGTFVTK